MQLKHKLQSFSLIIIAKYITMNVRLSAVETYMQQTHSSRLRLNRQFERFKKTPPENVIAKLEAILLLGILNTVKNTALKNCSNPTTFAKKFIPFYILIHKKTT